MNRYNRRDLYSIFFSYFNKRHVSCATRILTDVRLYTRLRRVFHFSSLDKRSSQNYIKRTNFSWSSWQDRDQDEKEILSKLLLTLENAKGPHIRTWFAGERSFLRSDASLGEKRRMKRIKDKRTFLDEGGDAHVNPIRVPSRRDPRFSRSFLAADSSSQIHPLSVNPCEGDDRRVWREETRNVHPLAPNVRDASCCPESRLVSRAKIRLRGRGETKSEAQNSSRRSRKLCCRYNVHFHASTRVSTLESWKRRGASVSKKGGGVNRTCFRPPPKLDHN